MSAENQRPAGATGIHAHPTMKLGALARPEGRKVCKLARYLDLSKFPTPPAVLDWQTAAPGAIQLFANDQVGDCAVAAYLHFKETVAANAAAQGAGGVSAGNVPGGTPGTAAGTAALPLTYKDPDDAINLYVAATNALNPAGGYEPGDDSTDCGLVLVDFLNWLLQRGDILAHAEVNFSNAAELRLARWLFGGVYWAFQLPEAAQGMTGTWDKPGLFNLGDPAPGSWGGHCVNDEAHGAPTADECTVTSWGRRIAVTPAFRQLYASEAHVIITKEWFAAQNGQAPNGFGLADLQNDLQQIAAAI